MSHCLSFVACRVILDEEDVVVNMVNLSRHGISTTRLSFELFLGFPLMIEVRQWEGHG